MNTELNTERHVKYIFLDVVGYTKGRSTETQSRIIMALNEIVLSSLKEINVANDERILLPTGDGICIGLLTPAECFDLHITLALTILRRLHKFNKNAKEEDRFFIRTGINHNTDQVINDINGNSNLAGNGINIASRIMNFADSNQILLSQAVYSELAARESYQGKFRPLEPTKIKHGGTIYLFQYVDTSIKWLNSTPPSNWQPKELTLDAAFYIAIALKERGFILKHQSIQDSYALIIMLWLKAHEYVISGVNPEQPQEYFTRSFWNLFGIGKATFSNRFNHFRFDVWDRGIYKALTELILEKMFHYTDCFTPNATGNILLLVNDLGVNRLRQEYPHIWDAFNLTQILTTK